MDKNDKTDTSVKYLWRNKDNILYKSSNVCNEFNYNNLVLL